MARPHTKMIDGYPVEVFDKQRNIFDVDKMNDIRWQILMDWITQVISPIKSVNNRYSSYGLKHIFQDDTRIYVTNVEFKVAMLKSGYSPYDEKELNWRFHISKRLRKYVRPLDLLSQVDESGIKKIGDIYVERDDFNRYWIGNTSVKSWGGGSLTHKVAAHFYNLVKSKVVIPHGWELAQIQIYIPDDTPLECEYSLEKWKANGDLDAFKIANLPKGLVKLSVDKNLSALR